MPSELKNLTADDYQFNVLVASVSLSKEEKQRKKSPGKGGRQRMVYNEVSS